MTTMLVVQIELNHREIEALLSDGTIVEDETYFRTLPGQTVLILRKPGENILRGECIAFDFQHRFTFSSWRGVFEVANESI